MSGSTRRRASARGLARASTSTSATNSVSSSVDSCTEESVVEAVVGKKYDEDGNLFYRLKWGGYDGKPTWEPVENCMCPDLIRNYERKVSRKQAARL